MNARHAGQGIAKAQEYLEQRAKGGAKVPESPQEWDTALWPKDDHLGIRLVQDYFAKYLYLPRLVYQELIIDAVRDGASSLTWRDCFAYAGGYDETAKRYLPLQAGRTGIAIMADGQSLIVKPDVAEKQMKLDEAKRTTTPTPPNQDPKNSLPSSGGTGGDDPTTKTLKPTAQPTKFHGSIELDATRLARDAATISTEILQHLAGKVGSRIKIVLDIDAEIPNGVDEGTIRTVTENLRTLKFDASSGFEQ